MLPVSIFVIRHEFTDSNKSFGCLFACGLANYRTLYDQLYLLSCGDVEAKPGPKELTGRSLSGLIINSRSIRNKVP